MGWNRTMGSHIIDSSEDVLEAFVYFKWIFGLDAVVELIIDGPYRELRFPVGRHFLVALLLLVG
jgi:hypothetical protein